MVTPSIWEANASKLVFPQLLSELDAEVLIIGGGITGITLAAQLAEVGQSAVLLEAGEIGHGTTAHSTGNLYELMDTPLSTFLKKYERETVVNVLKARREAIKQVLKYIIKYNIKADLTHCPWYLYATDDDHRDMVEDELKVAQDMGLKAFSANKKDIPVKSSVAIEVQGQMQFNPLKYVQQLAAAIPNMLVDIYEDSPVLEINKTADGYNVTTSKGVVHANRLVHATHTPKGILPQQTLLGPYREYGIACSLKKVQDYSGIYWGFHHGEKFSIRFYEQEGQQFLLVIGKRHKVGQKKDNEDNIEVLVRFAFEHFPVNEVNYRWGGQHYRPADLLPYIGETSEKEYIATGYATDGLVYGTLAGMIIRDQILGKENPWSELFNPSRFTPFKSAGNFVKENLNVAVQFLERLPDLSKDQDFANIQEQEGRIVEKDGHKLAVYRAPNKKIIVKSAICPHMGCIVHFNEAEKTWDCPCHGSRFSPEGKVLEGPALDDLKGITGENGKVHIL